jgi:hypothetical protein
MVGFGDPQRVRGTLVTGGLLAMLGVPPLRGRAITDDDARPGAPGTMVLSYGFWQSVFGADEGIIGRVVRLE